MAFVYRLRTAISSDAGQLSAIATRTFTDTFGHLYPEEELSKYLQEAYNLDTTLEDINNPSKYTVLLFHQNEEIGNDSKDTLCGYSTLHYDSIRTGDTDTNPSDYLELKRFYIDKEYHRKGAAQFLMDHLMDIMKTSNRQIIWLGVWENNLRAQKFYQRYGFFEKGEHIFKVGNVNDRDVLFELLKL